MRPLTPVVMTKVTTSIRRKCRVKKMGATRVRDGSTGIVSLGLITRARFGSSPFLFSYRAGTSDNESEALASQRGIGTKFAVLVLLNQTRYGGKLAWDEVVW